MQDPEQLLLLTHEDGIQASPVLSKIHPQQEVHDPSELNRAREIASLTDRIPVGILYRNDDVPCYEDLRSPERLITPKTIRTSLEAELDKFTVWPPAEVPEGAG